MDSPYKFRSARILVGFAVGLAGAVLTIALLNYFKHLSDLFLECVGLSFGLAISLYLALASRVRSLSKLFTFIVISIFAYSVAWFVTVLSTEWIGFSSSNSDHTSLKAAPSSAFFVGGFLGAFIVILSLLLLFSSAKSLIRVLSKSLLWSVFGGGLGVLGWLLGPSLGGIVLAILGEKEVLSSPGDLGTDYFYSIFLIWQSGMGLIIGSLLTELPSNIASTPEKTSHPLVSPQTKIARVILASLAIITVIFFAVRDIPSSYRSARWSRNYEQYRATRPSLENLPKIEPLAAEDVLIVKAITGYVPVRPMASDCKYASDPKTLAPTVPDARCYSLRYALPGAPNSGPNVGPHLDVVIKQFPDAAWAKFQLRDECFAVDLSSIETQTKFGNRIWVQHFGNQIDHGKYCWSSGSHMIMFEPSVSVNMEDFLKEYLQKFASSL